MIAVILGIRRSGTSLVAHLLQEMGIDMGQFNGKGASKWEWRNPIVKYYEDQEINRFNMKLLRAAGGTWTNPPEADALMAAAKELDREIKGLVGARSIRHSRWGFKDPRTPLTVAAWHPHLRKQDSLLRYIPVLRDPKSIARSNIKSKWRNGLKSAKAYLDLIEIYRERIVDFARYATPLPRVQAVEFEKFVDVRTAEMEVRKLCSIVGADFNPKLMDVIEYR